MSWLSKLKKYAPDLAAAIATGGATLPQLALKAIADATGEDVPTEQKLAQVVDTADPDTLLKIESANHAFKIRMKELNIELTVSELGDKQHAREKHKHSKMPALITFMMTCIVGGLFYYLFEGDVPEGNKDILYILIGQTSALWGASITYWVGTTRSSAEKNFRKLSVA